MFPRRLFSLTSPCPIVDRELPRILMIYDIDMPMTQAKASIRKRFHDNKDIKDERVQEMLVETGYFALETSMLQHKQKNHLMHFLEGYTVPMEAERKRLSSDASIEEQFARG
jgi:Complex 1 protein (LYR family)